MTIPPTPGRNVLDFPEPRRKYRKCATCARRFEVVAKRKHAFDCLSCWRIAQRGPRLKALMGLMAQLLGQPKGWRKCIQATGISASSLDAYCRGARNPSAERALALDEWSRREAAKLRAAQLKAR